MPNTLPRMKLSPEEHTFLRQWIYDEVHYQDGPGPAKALQLRHGASPADLGVLIAAAIPDVREQEAAAAAFAQTPPIWPWTESTFRDRVAEARSVLAERRRD